MVMQFTPSAENTRAYRDALGQFATGVTIVTAPSPTGGVGMTANSFSSVSLDPALVLWALSKKSARYPFFAKTDRFAIHVLRADQSDLAQTFAKDGHAFDTVASRLGAFDVPLLEDCLARFECRTSALHDAGDHAIMVGAVTDVMVQEGAPLVFAQSTFGQFTS